MKLTVLVNAWLMTATVAQSQVPKDTALDALDRRRAAAVASVGHSAGVTELYDSVPSHFDERDRVVRRKHSGGGPSATSHTGEMYFGIPEYHDEQHFQIGTSTFGPMVWLYASPFLGAFRRMSDIQEQGEFGAFAALVDVETISTAPEYANLGLTALSNCLWLANPTGNSWEGHMLPIDAVTGRCERPTTANPGTKLAVWRQSAPGRKHEDYPAVARFGEGRPATGNTWGPPVIGVKCLDGWCEIGPSGAAPRVSAVRSYGKLGIKGWHDEQMLMSELTPGGPLMPIVRAAVLPDRNLADYSLRSFPVVNRTNREAGWIPVATIVLEANPDANSKYWKWGLRGGENHVFLRRIASDTWQMSVVSTRLGSRVIWNRVTREAHTDVLVPPTARWRFASFDPQGVWIRCGEACCAGDGGG